MDKRTLKRQYKESEIPAGQGDRVPHQHHQQVLRRRLRGEGVTTEVAVDPLLRYRDRFPILQRTKYLVSHSLGAMPEATRDALAEEARQAIVT